MYGYILAHSSRAQPITVGKSWQQGRGTARFRKRNGNRNCPDEEFRWNEERNGPGKAGGACLNQGRSFDSRQDRQETGGEQTEVGQLRHQVQYAGPAGLRRVCGLILNGKDKICALTVCVVSA